MSAYMFEHEKDQPVLHLTRQQSELLLRNTRHGRLAFLADDHYCSVPFLAGRLVFAHKKGVNR